jgi:basic amino acid/polyamine antiporter, APA family
MPARNAVAVNAVAVNDSLKASEENHMNLEVESPKPRSGHLLRVLGAGFGVAVGVGTTIGSGILRTPGEIARELHSVPLILAVWALGGVYALLCCTSLTELGTMLPNAGGFYVYARRAFGTRIGFVVGCCNAVAQAVALAYLAVALGEFSTGLFPALTGHTQLIGVTGLILLSLLNWMGLRPGSRAQEITSIAKTIGLLGLVIACFLRDPGATTVLGAVLPGHAHNLFLGLMVALPGVIITYDGWYGPIYFVEEDKDPSRNLPRAMFGTVLCCAAIYLLLNGAYLHVLGLNRLAGSQLPAADAAMLVFGKYGRQFILLISVVAVLSSMNALLMLLPRILFAMGRDGLLPRSLAGVNQGGTPAPALLLSCIAGILLVLSGTYDSLIAMASILFVAIYGSCFAALIVLRKREPLLVRPYRAWLYPWTTTLVLLVSVGFLAGSVIGDLRHSILTAVLILVSYTAAIFIDRRSRSKAA